MSPAMLFIDEVESLFGSRDAQGGLGRKIIAQLMIELDYVNAMSPFNAPASVRDGKTSTQHRRKAAQVMVLAATNHPQLLDASLLQPGRFEKVIHVPLPDLEARTQILTTLGKKAQGWAAAVDVDLLAKSTAGFTGSDLRGLTGRAALAAITRDPHSECVLWKDFQTALSSVTASVAPEEATRLQHWKPL
jgi:transitional endoplasmic reticulum ATPase